MQTSTVSLQRIELAEKAWDLRSRLESGEEVGDELAAAERKLDGRAWKIPFEELPGLEAELSKSVRRAQRMDAEPPLFQVVCEETVEVTSASSGVASARKVALLVLVGGEVSPSEGWRYLACLDHGLDPSGSPLNSIVRLPGAGNVDLSHFGQAEPRCEHCNLKRKRKVSFLVEGPDKQVRQVGSGCLTDYIGGSTAEQAARYAESLLDLTELLSQAESKVKSLSSWSGSDPSRTGFFDPEQYMGWVCRNVDLHGFVSRRESLDTGHEATADRARSELLGALRGSNSVRLTASQEQEGRDIITWARGRFSGDRSKLSEYESKVASAMDQPLCDYRSLPLLAGLYPAYQRHQALSASPSKHLASPGERIEVEARVEGVSERETAYGLQRIYRLTDVNGNELTWFSTSSDLLEEGQLYRLRGTVKRHDDFKGVPRTVLTRCKVLS